MLMDVVDANREIGIVAKTAKRAIMNFAMQLNVGLILTGPGSLPDLIYII